MTAIARKPSSFVSKIQSWLSNGSLALEACIGSMNSGKGRFTRVKTLHTRTEFRRLRH
jgi:hypothetical protein